MPKPKRILRPAQTEAITGLCDREMREREAEGRFPRRFLLDPNGRGRAVGHLEEEVLAWIDQCVAKRDQLLAETGSAKPTAGLAPPPPSTKGKRGRPRKVAPVEADAVAGAGQ